MKFAKLRRKITTTFAAVILFVPVPGDVGEIQQVISGRTYAEDISADTLPTSISQFAGITRRVRVEETAPGSAINQDLIFTLTDAEGNMLDEAKIAAAHFTSGVLDGRGEPYLAVSFGSVSGTAFHNSVPVPGHLHSIIGPNNIRGMSRDTALVVFSDDGHSVTVSGLRANEPSRKMWLEATFFISTDVNFEGDVFVTLGTSGASTIHPDATMQIAEVERMFDIESSWIYIVGRYSSITSHDIVISERLAGALVYGRQIELSLSDESGAHVNWSMGIGLNPIASRDISTTGSLGVSALPQSLGWHSIRMAVDEQSVGQTPSVLTISDICLFVSQSAPIGAYGVIVHGSAILDNDLDMINLRSDGRLAMHAPEFRRYGFRDSGLALEPYVIVTMPGGVDIHSNWLYDGWTVANPSQGQETGLQILVERQGAPENVQFRADWVRVGRLTGGVVYSSEMFTFNENGFFNAQLLLSPALAEHSGSWELRVVTIVDGNEKFGDRSRTFVLSVQEAH